MGYRVLLFFSLVMVLMGFSLRRNWWGMADQMSGRHLAAHSIGHERSRRWGAVRIFGGILVAFGFFMALAFFYRLVRGVS
ncbi:hypothetical protein [Streptomyces parvus]|uniref:Uncharacterized protein n=1 Tax=Streptomyces parvus TaxID=66428 RepID=A0A7K3S403_9ACTN|nr:hypothetical protein [Streptomyces parvus]NEC22043.1 hypothetical protein [Streptomyces parvus]